MNGTILIAGGSGFIGRSLVKASLEEGLKVSVIALHNPVEKYRIDGVIYRQADLTDAAQTDRVLKGKSFDYVVNLSGYIDHSLFLNGGRKAIGVHFDGVQNLLQSLDWSRLKRFVQVGSSDEYGNLPAPQHELMREAPISPYSLAKVASTQLLQMLYRTESLPIVVVRFFLVYGEGQDDKRFLPQVIRGCLEDRQFPTSVGEQLRDFCHVEDVSRGIISALREEKALGEVINLASGRPVSIRQMIEKVKCLVGKGQPQFGEIAYRPGENMALYADVGKAAKVLGWQARVSLDEGLQRSIEFYGKN